MGTMDALIGFCILGIAAVAIFFNIDAIETFIQGGLNLSPTIAVGEPNPSDTVEDPTTPPVVAGDCKALCKAADCDGYDSAGCTAGCSACKGSNRAMVYHNYQTYYY